MQKRCLVCTRPFTVLHYNVKTCGALCAQIRQHQMAAERHEQQAKILLSQLAQLRKEKT